MFPLASRFAAGTRRIARDKVLLLPWKTGELPIVEMLVKAGANVNTVEKFQNQTPLMWAAAAPKNAGEMMREAAEAAAALPQFLAARVSGCFQQGHRQQAAGRGCRSQCGAQYASPQPGRQ